MKGIFLTDCGQVRSHNEDAGGIYYNASNQLMAVIADGMGGHKAGDVASQMAVSQLQKYWEDTSSFSSPNEIEEWLHNAVELVNKSIYNHAQEHKEYEGMGTTIVIAIHINDFLTVAHVGDSRCYLLNESGFRQITQDHSLVNALIQSGQISKDDAKYHPRKNVVLRALGSEPKVDTDIITTTLEKDDKIVLCTDGLTDKIHDEEIHEFIHQHNDLEETGQHLVDMANKRGGEDNISLIILFQDISPDRGESN